MSRVEHLIRSTNASSPLGKPEPSLKIPAHSDALISSGFFGVDFAATLWHGPGVCALRTRVYSDRGLALSHIEFVNDSGKGFVWDRMSLDTPDECPRDLGECRLGRDPS